jgi:hypothetical protein
VEQRQDSYHTELNRTHDESLEMDFALGRFRRAVETCRVSSCYCSERCLPENKLLVLAHLTGHAARLLQPRRQASTGHGPVCRQPDCASRRRLCQPAHDGNLGAYDLAYTVLSTRLVFLALAVEPGIAVQELIVHTPSYVAVVFSLNQCSLLQRCHALELDLRAAKA